MEIAVCDQFNRMVFTCIKIQKHKYFLFFFFNSLLDPIYSVLRYTFNLQTYNFFPFIFFVQAIAFPTEDSKSKIISFIALLLIIMNLGSNPLLELAVCEVVLSLLIYNLLVNIHFEVKSESSLSVFQILLFGFFIRNILMIFFYYSDQEFLYRHFIIFQSIMIVFSLLITYLGPDSKIKLKRYKKRVEKKRRIKYDLRQLSIVQYDPNNFMKELTRTEIRVLKLLAEGYDAKGLSETMFISKRTVYFHIQNLKNKLNINTTARLRKFAIENIENLPKIKEPVINYSVPEKNQSNSAV